MATTDPKLHLEQPRSAFGTWVGVVLLFAVFALFVWAMMGLLPRGDRYEQTRALARAEKLKTASEEAHTALTTYGWVDKEKGIVHMPIQRAMELTAAELAQHKPAAAGPIAPAGAEPGIQATAPVQPAPVAPPQVTPSTSPVQTAREGPGSAVGGQPAAEANPAGAPAGSQPGPQNPPPLPPSSTTREFQRGGALPTPVQTAPGVPNPVPGATP